MKFVPMSIAAFCLASALPAPAAAQADPALDRMIAGYSSMVGERSPEGAAVRRVWADGRTMVLSIEAPAGYDREPAWLASAIATGICGDAQGQAFFQSGHAIRVELTNAGTAMRTATRDACPTEAPSED